MLKSLFLTLAALVGVYLMYQLCSPTRSDLSVSQQVQSDCIAVQTHPVIEDFVPHNAREVGKGLATIVQLDALGMRSAFDSIVQADSGKFNTGSLPPFRQAEPGRDEVNRYIDAVLEKANEAADRRFVRLDLQSVKRESSFDPKDRGLVDRYTINMFVQEKDSRRVHAAAYNISTTFIVKPSTFNAAGGDDGLQVVELYFVTDHFYKNPLVGGDNVYDRDFRLQNPYHLTQPFFTTDDKVLLSDDQQIGVLKDHHHDLRTPQYRCFEDGVGDSKATNAEECNGALGHWDKPVERDEECPFFRSNRNYVNRLGGVNPDGDFCEMPINAKRVGYRFVSVDPVHRPWCYNCRIGADGNPGTIGPCCEEQRNKQLYPNLVGPDYAFQGDQLERGQQWAELADRGLHWQTHPTKIRDIANSHQRQPVFNAIIGGGPGPMDASSVPN